MHGRMMDLVSSLVRGLQHLVVWLATCGRSSVRISACQETPKSEFLQLVYDRSGCASLGRTAAGAMELNLNLFWLLFGLALTLVWRIN